VGVLVNDRMTFDMKGIRNDEMCILHTVCIVHISRDERLGDEEEACWRSWNAS
jgi:hypothetical protein